MQHTRSFAIKIALLSLVFVLASCGWVRLGYSHGETITYWWLNGYVDFESDQKISAKKSIHNIFAWHRKAELPDYRQFMQAEQKKLQNDLQHSLLLVSAEDVRNHPELSKRQQSILEKSLPEFADLALTLRLTQIANIEKKFTSNNDKYRKEYLRGDVEQRQLFRFKKTMEQAEYWFGSFSPEQEALIRKASDARPLNNELKLAQRMDAQRNLTRILKKIQSEKLGRDAAVALIKDHLSATLAAPGSDEHKAFFDASRASHAHMSSVILSALTVAQKAHASKRLQNWIDTFQEQSKPAHGA